MPDVKYELLFAEIDYTAKTSKQSQKRTIYKAHVHLDPDIKETKIGGEVTEFIRATKSSVSSTTRRAPAASRSFAALTPVTSGAPSRPSSTWTSTPTCRASTRTRRG